MICPECGTEYRAGIVTCADCGIDLVEEIETPPSARLVSLTVTQDSGLIAALADHLEKAGVPYVIEAGTALPLLDDRLIDEPAPWSARVWVIDTLEDRARKILARILESAPAPHESSRPFPGVE